MRETLTTLGEIVGAGLVVAGVSLFSVPFGLIVAGLLVIAVCFAASEGA